MDRAGLAGHPGQRLRRPRPQRGRRRRRHDGGARRLALALRRVGRRRHDLHRVRGAHHRLPRGRRRGLRRRSARSPSRSSGSTSKDRTSRARTARAARIRSGTSGRRTSRNTAAGRRPPGAGSGSSRCRPSTTRRSATSRRSWPTVSSPRSGTPAATADQIRAAVDAGARWSTHLGNGAHAMIRRHPNYIWDQLAEDRLSAGFIFDGHHLPPAVMKSVIRAKGIERSILVSDAALRRRAGAGRLPPARRGGGRAAGVGPSRARRQPVPRRAPRRRCRSASATPSVTPG